MAAKAEEGQPTLSVPISGHFEQILNGRYLEHEGYGRFATSLDGASVHAFLGCGWEPRSGQGRST